MTDAGALVDGAPVDSPRGDTALTDGSLPDVESCEMPPCRICPGAMFYEGAPDLSAGLDVDLVDGDAAFEAGFQGSLMLTPTLTIDPLLGGSCVRVLFEQLPDEDFPDEDAFDPYTQTMIAPLMMEGLNLRTDRLENILSASLDGRHIVLRITVRGENWVRQIERHLHIVDPDGYGPCDLYPVGANAGGTYFRVVRGQMRYLPTEFGMGCAALADVTVSFTPNDTFPDCEVPTEFTISTTRGCYELVAARTTAELSARINLSSSGSWGEPSFSMPLFCACE